jgi:hypothetical protein
MSQKHGFVHWKALGALAEMKTPCSTSNFIVMVSRNGKQFSGTQILLSLGCASQ